MQIKISKHNTTVDISKEIIDLYSFSYYDEIDCDEMVKKDIRTLYEYFYNSNRKKGISGLITRALIYDVYFHYKYNKVREGSCRDIEEKYFREKNKFLVDLEEIEYHNGTEEETYPFSL